MRTDSASSAAGSARVAEAREGQAQPQMRHATLIVQGQEALPTADATPSTREEVAEARAVAAAAEFARQRSNVIGAQQAAASRERVEESQSHVDHTLGGVDPRAGEVYDPPPSCCNLM